MELGYFGSSLFYFAMICSLVHEAYFVINVSQYAAVKWDAMKASPPWLLVLDVIYGGFIIALCFTIYWKHAVLIFTITLFHVIYKRRMNYHVFIADYVLCFIILLTILFYQLGAS